MPNIADNITERITNPKYYFIDNGIISLLAVNIRTSLLENMVALSLIRRYGSKDSVYHYNHGIEVDFYIRETEMAIQACYSFKNASETSDREVKGLIQIVKFLPCRRRVIVTYEDEAEWDCDGMKIEVIPAWKFLLEK